MKTTNRHHFYNSINKYYLIKTNNDVKEKLASNQYSLALYIIVKSRSQLTLFKTMHFVLHLDTHLNARTHTHNTNFEDKLCFPT